MKEQTRSTPSQASGPAPIQHSLVPRVVRETIGSPGRALEPESQTRLESQFGHDFSQVRVHTDESAIRSARAVGARAFTVGRHIVWGERQLTPEKPAAKQLLAHELTHVLQQDSSAAKEAIGPAAASTTHSLEMQAEHAAETVVEDGRVSGISRATLGVPILQRRETSPARKEPVSPRGSFRTLTTASFRKQKLNVKNVQHALGIVKSTQAGRQIMDVLERKGLSVLVRFVADAQDLPKGHRADTAGVFLDKGNDQFEVYVVAGERKSEMVPSASGGSLELTARLVDRDVTGIAETLFHELVHIWFVSTYPDQGTGHTHNVKPPRVFLETKTYDPDEYDARFLEQLRTFDRQLKRVKKRTQQEQ